MLRLKNMYPDALHTRYKLEPLPDSTGYELLEEAAKKRGFLISGGEADTGRMAITLLRELHEGKLGRLSLERPE
jgi:ribosome biogenesis GTPase A